MSRMSSCTLLALLVPAGPVVAGAAAVVRQEHVFRVEQVADVAVLDCIDHPAARACSSATCSKARDL